MFLATCPKYAQVPVHTWDMLWAKARWNQQYARYVQAITDFPGPLRTNYRRFIPNFADIAAPLSDLTKASLSNKVRWTPGCIHNIEEGTREQTGLEKPKFPEPFTLQTGASKVRLGAVLSQTDDPVTFVLCRERRGMQLSKKSA